MSRRSIFTTPETIRPQPWPQAVGRVGKYGYCLPLVLVATERARAAGRCPGARLLVCLVARARCPSLVRFGPGCAAVARTPTIAVRPCPQPTVPTRTLRGAPPPPFLFKLPYFLTFFKGCPCRGLGIFDVGRSRDVPPLAANASPSPAWLSKFVVVIRVLSHR